MLDPRPGIVKEYVRSGPAAKKAVYTYSIVRRSSLVSENLCFVTSCSFTDARLRTNSALSAGAFAYAWNSAGAPASASRPAGLGREKRRDRNSDRSGDISSSAL